MSIWTPPAVSRDLRGETDQRQVEALKALRDEAQWSWVEEFNRDLHNVYPGMKLLWCPDPAPVEAVAMGARPGRWGILMPSVKGGPVSVKPILGPNDEFVDPSCNASAIFESLRQGDWWSPEAKRERERAQAEAKRMKKRREQQERDDFNQEVLEHYLAKSRAFVSMSGPWAQNQSGRKAIKKEKT